MECCSKRFVNKSSLTRHIRSFHAFPEEDISKPKIVCDRCQKIFNRKDNLLRHWRTSHEGTRTPKNFVCDSCGKSFSKKSRLLSHLRKFHVHLDKKSIVTSSKYSSKAVFQCAVCHVHVESTAIINHYADVHKIVQDYEYFDFDNEEYFAEWKKSVEKSTLCKYVKAYSSSKYTTKFICHRSGEFRSKSTGIRNLKTQGTEKINGFCPAHIYKVTTNSKIHVRFSKTHVGHGRDLCHLLISPSKKLEIASKLIQRVPKRDILSDVRDSYTGGECDRVHLLTRKDIYNIAQKYNLEDYRRHKSDGISVNMIVDERKSSILYYKSQDTIDESQPFLEAKNFVLIMMNDAQAELLKEFGNNIIAVDGTHGAGYDFTLHTVIVLDELHQGFPIASMISDRKDGDILTLFFTMVQRKIEVDLRPEVFMSDMAEELYISFISVFGPPKRRFFCSWHVVKAWKENLRSKINNASKREETYKKLRSLLEETDENKFCVLLAEIINSFNSDCELQDFQTYFCDHYVPKVEFWAYCFRKHQKINTNMSLERIHKTIKYYYLDAKCSQRLDKFLHHFLEFIRDRLFDRLVLKNKGKVSYKLRELRKRHKNATNEVMVMEQEGIFIVSSKDSVYYVTLNNDSCDCKLICDSCQTCIHKFVCTCIDNAIKWNMCKHIHAVCLHINCKMPSGATSLQTTSEFQCNMIGHKTSNTDNIEQTHTESTVAMNTEQATLSSSQCKSTANLDEILALHKEILGLITNEKGCLKYLSLLRQAKECISMYEKNQSAPSQLMIIDRPSAKIDPKKKIQQQRLYSTKKKRSKPAGLQIPTADERSSLYLKSLSGLPNLNNNISTIDIVEAG